MTAPQLLSIALLALAAGDTPSPLPDMQAIVGIHRKAIVLLEAALPGDRGQRERAALVGRILFQEKHRRLTDLADRLAGDVRTTAAAGWPAQPPVASVFLEAIEREPGWVDADKLAFRDALEVVRAAAARGPTDNTATRAFRARLSLDARFLAAVEGLYGRELSDLSVRSPTPSLTSRRVAWDRYTAFVCSLYDRDSILRENAAALEAIEETRVPRGVPESRLEISGTELPLGTVLMTFDDGPHARFTDRILETLAEHGAKAVFFEVGERVGRIEADDELRESSGAAIARRVLAAGMAIGNHSFTHPLMPRLSDEAIAGEIEKTSRLLAEIIGSPPVLFRPPYGAADDRVLAAVETHRMRSVLWTVDSKDWADPIAASIAERVIREVRAEGCGIVLFHDIHGQTTEALPIVLDVLQASGFRFLAWNGSAFAPPVPSQ